MESLSRLIFQALTESVESGVRANIPLVQNIHHRLHFVPQVSHPGVGSNNRPAKGFGFIYFAQINVLGANFQVYVPINFLFAGSLSLIVDPIQLDVDEQQTIDQIYVKENLLDGIDLNISEQIIRDNIIEAIGHASLPILNPNPNLNFSDSLLIAIRGATRNPSIPYPSNYNILLTPSGENRNLANTILWDQPVVGSVLNFNQVDLFFLE